MKRIGYVAIILVLSIIFNSQVLAVELTCFNELFERNIGQPRQESHTFNALATQATVKVYNGDGDHWLKRAIAAKVQINGEEVFGPSDFKKRVAYLEAQVNLLNGENSLDVNLHGMPGVKFRVEIVQDGIFIPDTGQTTSYTDIFGEDSDYTINPQSYTKLDANGNDLPDSAPAWAMVRDNVTKLIWEVKNHKDGVQDYSDFHDADNTYYWCDINPETNGGDQGTCTDGTDTEDFIEALNAQNFGGYNDWRLPTVMELSQLLHYDKVQIPISSAYFPNTMNWVYQTSTTCAQTPSSSWVVDFWLCKTDYSMPHNKTNSHYVRAVRGGKCSPCPSLVDNGDGTVTDIQTGLMWQQSEPGTMPWEAALTYCENLELAGYDDWRLPNCNELQTIVDYSKYDPAIDLMVFPTAFSNAYWTSTTSAHSPGGGGGRSVIFIKGDIEIGANKLYGFYVRAVRGGL